MTLAVLSARGQDQTRAGGVGPRTQWCTVTPNKARLRDATGASTAMLLAVQDGSALQVRRT